jgi:ATP-dependent Clp protease adapter protein ClpS
MSQNQTNGPEFPSNRAKSHLEMHASNQPRRRDLPRYRVILLREGINDIMLVVRTVMELTHFCRTEATHKMWEAHHVGRSILLTTYRERAELYVEQFTDRGVAVTLEPA